MNRIFRATGVEAMLDVEPIDHSLQQVAACVTGETGASAEDLEEQYVAELVSW